METDRISTAMSNRLAGVLPNVPTASAPVATESVAAATPGSSDEAEEGEADDKGEISQVTDAGPRTQC